MHAWTWEAFDEQKRQSCTDKSPLSRGFVHLLRLAAKIPAETSHAVDQTERGWSDCALIEALALASTGQRKRKKASGGPFPVGQNL